MNLDNADEMWTDVRGNRWIKTSVDKTDQHFLNTVRKNWMEVSDDDILKAKKTTPDVSKYDEDRERTSNIYRQCLAESGPAACA